MKGNDIYELQPSMYDIGTRLKEKFKSELLNHLHSCGEGKKLRTYVLQQITKCESLDLRLVKNRTDTGLDYAK